MKKVFRTIAGVILGYALMVILITLVQETWFGGVGWYESSPGVLTIAGILTCVSGAIGAIIATIISRPTGRAAALIMGSLVVIETTVLTLTDKLSGPLWFDILASLSLIIAIIIGAEILLRLSNAADHQTYSA